MSKFCLLCNTYTNCTDNCNACLAEEDNNATKGGNANAQSRNQSSLHS